MRRRLKLIIAIPILILMIQLIALRSEIETSASITVYIERSGLAYVSISTNLSRGLNAINLPIKPLVATIEAYVNDSEVPVIYSNGTLYIASPLSGKAVIRYVASSIYRNNTFELEISGRDFVKIVVSPEIILLIDPSKIVSSNIYPNGTLETVLEAPIKLVYMIKISTNQTTAVGAEQIVSNQLIPVILIIPPVIAVATVITYSILRRYRRKVSAEIIERLDNVDISILRYLEQRGGSAMQSEIQRDLILPKTTLWRHIRRLEREGFVRVEKIGQQNKIVLLKKPKI